MFVDREGVHCIIVSDYELFYNNWESDQIISINSICSNKTSNNES
jgi:hypothetical protein